MNHEVASALDLARESLSEARWDLRGGHWRGAVRSAYYAMFHAAEALLLADNRQFSSHQTVISTLGREFAAVGRLPRHLHMYLARAFRARQEADYSRQAQFGEEDGKLWIARAEEFLAGIEELLSCGEWQAGG